MGDRAARKPVSQHQASGLDSEVFDQIGIFAGPLLPEPKVVHPQGIVASAIDRRLAFAKPPVVAVRAVAFDVQLVGLLDGSACNVYTDYLTFGTINTSSSSPVNITGTFQVNCNPGVTAVLSLGDGQNFTTQRRMNNNLTGYIPYGVFTDAARTIPFNSTNTISYTGTGAVELISVYGQILPADMAGAPAGNYYDASQITMTFTP